MMKACVNAWNAPISCRMRLKKMIGVRMGTVTFQNRRSTPAPSTAAADRKSTRLNSSHVASSCEVTLFPYTTLFRSFHVQVQGVEQCRIRGSSASTGDDEGLRKRLERTDQLQDEIEEDDRGEDGYRDVPESAQHSGPIDRGRRSEEHASELQSRGQLV